MLGGTRGQEEKGTTEDEMAGWHHWLGGPESEWTPGVGDGQGVLVCCDSWGLKELDTTERLNWTELNIIFRCDVRHKSLESGIIVNLKQKKESTYGNMRVKF